MASILWIWPAGRHESDLLTFCTYFMACRHVAALSVEQSSGQWPYTKNNCSNVIVVDAMPLLRFSHNRFRDRRRQHVRQSTIVIFFCFLSIENEHSGSITINRNSGSERWSDERKTFLFPFFCYALNLAPKLRRGGVKKFLFCLFIRHYLKLGEVHWITTLTTCDPK